MNRRQFSKSGIVAAAAGVTGGLQAQPGGNRKYYEWRVYELRNDLDTAGFHSFMEKTYLPLLKKQVSGPIGAFNVASGEYTPSLILLLQYDSPAQVMANTDLTAGAGAALEAWKEFETKGMPFVRCNSQLFKAFAGHPAITLPPAAEKPHLFELRVYESKNTFKAVAKIEMFNVEEVKIFRDCGMSPVFFGEAVIGNRLPHLTYMMAYADMAERDKLWGVFGKNPDWNRIKNEPRFLDTVSSIHASFLSPAAYSEVR